LKELCSLILQRQMKIVKTENWLTDELD